VTLQSEKEGYGSPFFNFIAIFWDVPFTVTNKKKQGDNFAYIIVLP
jgi:hypothetical protein